MRQSRQGRYQTANKDIREIHIATAFSFSFKLYSYNYIKYIVGKASVMADERYFPFPPSNTKTTWPTWRENYTVIHMDVPLPF